MQKNREKTTKCWAVVGFDVVNLLVGWITCRKDLVNWPVQIHTFLAVHWNPKITPTVWVGGNTLSEGKRERERIIIHKTHTEVVVSLLWKWSNHFIWLQCIHFPKPPEVVDGHMCCHCDMMNVCIHWIPFHTETVVLWLRGHMWPNTLPMTFF